MRLNVPSSVFSWMLALALFPTGSAKGQPGPDSAPAPARASVSDQLQDAKNLFAYQDFQRAAEELKRLLKPEVLLSDRGEIRQAREIYAACLWYLDRKSEARSEFTLLLVAFPNHRLDPFEHVPELIRFYEELRDELVAQKAIDPDAPPDPRDIPGPDTLRVERRTIHHNPFVTTLVPFGVGQFQNGDTALGTVFLVSEVLSLSATIATYFLILDTRISDPDRARQFEKAFWASQGVFLALVAGGITEAIVSYESERIEINTMDVPIAPVPEGRSGPLSGMRPNVRVLRDQGLSFGLSGRF